MAENSARETSIYNEENKTAGQPLSDFLLQLEDYTPTVLHVFHLIEFFLKKII